MARYKPVLLVVFETDRNLKQKLAVLLTSQWYYLITLLAAKQYYTTEKPGQELHILHRHLHRSTFGCLLTGTLKLKRLSRLDVSVKVYRLKTCCTF